MNNRITEKAQFQIKELLGENRSQGRKTYHAVHLATKTSVVIKEFNFREGNSWDGYKAIEKEEAVLKRLNHPKIPAYLGRFETECSVCLVQEYIDAASLQGCLLNPNQGKAWGVELLKILDYAHNNGVLHNDIKPSNIIGGKDGPYLIDFGAGREDIGTGTVGISTMLAGTPGYTPPERIIQRKSLPCSDLYSLGVTLVVLMSEKKNIDITQYIDHQFNIDFGRLLQPEVSWEFRDWLKKMCHADYRQRYQTAKDAMSALQRLEPWYDIRQDYKVEIKADFGEEEKLMLEIEQPNNAVQNGLFLSGVGFSTEIALSFFDVEEVMQQLGFSELIMLFFRIIRAMIRILIIAGFAVAMYG